MDVKNGDFLVVGDKTYNIRSVAAWFVSRPVMASMRRLSRTDAKTTRNPAVVNGKRGEPVDSVTGLKCSPIDPVDAELKVRMGINTPHTVSQTFITDGTGFVHLVLEDLQS